MIILFLYVFGFWPLPAAAAYVLHEFRPSKFLTLTCLNELVLGRDQRARPD